MFIKRWNNYDGGVLKVDPSVKRMLSNIDPEDLEVLEDMAEGFAEEIGLEFEHNLMEGWQEKMLFWAMVTDPKNGDLLMTKESIDSVLDSVGSVEFHAYRSRMSAEFLKELKKLKEERWP
ncbi:hypothetical protein ACFLZC_02055 [Patescibacteria group bacterium]